METTDYSNKFVTIQFSCCGIEKHQALYYLINRLSGCIILGYKLPGKICGYFCVPKKWDAEYSGLSKPLLKMCLSKPFVMIVEKIIETTVNLKTQGPFLQQL